MVALGLLILRLVIGLILAAHGALERFGWLGGPGMTGWTGAMNRMRIRPATPWAWMSALAEFVGGIGLALGLLFPLPSAAIAGSMVVAIALVHLPKGFFVSKGGYESTLALLPSVAALALTGPDSVSLDSAVRS